MKVENGYRLFKDTYLFEITDWDGIDCLAIAKVDKSGRIISLSKFGNKKTVKGVN